MNEKDKPLGSFPADSKKIIDQIWQALPESEKNSLVGLLDKLPTKSNLWKLLIRLAGEQTRVTVGRKRRVTIVGPANTGKSTLYNQFIQAKENVAVVSPVPGTTRENQEAGAGVFSVVDTPGADAAGELGEEERRKAFTAAAEADFLIILFDAVQGIKQAEVELYGRLLALNKPYIVVLNKIDLVRKEQQKVVQRAAETLNLEPHQVIPISAREATNLSQVLLAIAAAEPEIVAALGSALPQYRWQLAWRVIASSASLSGVIALTPLPVIDFVPLLANQTSMVLSIARIYNYEIDFRRARELVVTFGLGFLGRTLFYQLSKFGGIPGWLLSSAIAASTTVAMGYAAVQWFERGERLSREQLNILTRRVTSMLLDTLKNVRNRRERIKLQKKIEISLQESPLSQQPPDFENIPPKPPE